MPTTYSGDPRHITTPLTRTVNGAVASGGLIKIQTSVAHLFATADVVVISGVTGTTEANGTWYITVVDSTHFTLDGSTFTNAYVSGGTAVDHALTPAFSEPSDGDPGTAQSIDAALQMLADRTQYLKSIQGGFRCLELIMIAPPANAGSYTSNLAYDTTQSVSLGGPVANLLAGDVVEVSLGGSLELHTPNAGVTVGEGHLRLEFSENFGTITAFNSGNDQAVLTTRFDSGAPTFVDQVVPYHLSGLRVVVTPGQFRVWIDGYVTATTDVVRAVYCAGYVKVWRPIS